MDGRAEDGAATAHGAPEGALVVDRAKLGDDLEAVGVEDVGEVVPCDDL